MPNVNTSRAPSEQQVVDLQVQALENIIVSGDIKVDEADQLQEL